MDHVEILQVYSFKQSTTCTIPFVFKPYTPNCPKPGYHFSF